MNEKTAIAIFDIGKTNKKLFVFNEQYKILLERNMQFDEVIDEDGDACENLDALTQWVKQSINELMEMKDIILKAINFSTYGASFVYVNNSGEVIAPLYNYLKPFDPQLKDAFYFYNKLKYPASLYDTTSLPVCLEWKIYKEFEDLSKNEEVIK